MFKREYGEPLAGHTSFKIGGPAFCWVEPDSFSGVLEAVSFAEENKRPLFVIGKGSNVLVQDTGFDGVVLNLGNSFDYVELEENGCVLRIGAGTAISKVVNKTLDLGLAGCEFLSGIPGSFGGAVFMNAGVRNAVSLLSMIEIKDILLDADVVDIKDKKRQSLNKNDISFSYRASMLDGKCILGARVRLKKDSKDMIGSRIKAFLKNRVAWAKIGFPSAGSIFKNPSPENPAGKLIDQCGLKGKRIGGAEISKYHANIIVNRGNAVSKDVLGLMELARKKVRDKFGIELESELKII